LVKYFEGTFDYIQTWNAIMDQFDIDSLSDPSVAALNVADMKKLGQDTYYFDQYSLRHTTNASNRGYYNVADVGVNKLYTQSQFLNEITDPAYWVFPCPDEILGALATVFADLATADSAHLQSALKGGSPRSTTSNNRVNITTEYAIDVWSTLLYAPL
jgi:hypothetical protein